MRAPSAANVGRKACLLLRHAADGACLVSDERRGWPGAGAARGSRGDSGGAGAVRVIDAPRGAAHSFAGHQLAPLPPPPPVAPAGGFAAVERAQCWHLQSVQCCRQRGHRRPAALSTHSGNRCARRGGFAREAAVHKRCRRNDDDAARCCSAHGARKPSSRPKKHHTPSHCKRSTASWWGV